MEALIAFDADRLQGLIDSQTQVWLDLVDPKDEDLVALGEMIGLHQLAIEDSREFGQRPKLDRYGDRLLLVFYGLLMDRQGIPRQSEVHIHVTPAAVVTISRWPAANLDRVRASLHNDADCTQRELLYRVLDAITDSLNAGLDQLANQLNTFEKTIYTRPRAADRDHMAKAGRKLNELRRTLVTQRQVWEHATEHLKAAEGHENMGPYLGDIGDHLWQAQDEVEADRESIHEMLNTYSNSVQERLTVVATIFLPLTALTGFFGMNFAWLTNHIGSTWTFFGIGVGGLLASCALISLWLRRSGLTDRRGRTT